MLIDDLYHLMRMYRYRSSSRKGRAQEALREHRAIVDAMRRRDAERAELLMRQHIARARLAVDNLPDSREPSKAKKSAV